MPQGRSFTRRQDMGWTKSKKSSFKAGDRVTVPGGYGDGTITEFEDGCGGGELASVKLDSGRQEWVGVSRLKAAGPKKSTDKKADDYELYVRDVIRTSDGRLGLIKDFTYGGCSDQYAVVMFHDGQTREYNVSRVTLVAAATR
ncbi:MAG TPA: hypothetical protein DCS06_02795 [Candidatus Yanofskybacteria bacterium]|nr:MAG: hypothetical protein A2207_03370 [Candidatus Yanofskybacteria bacterium RIFOXYA1_FULL_44_17]OGN36327.1 MAG: hypothetical protein A2241_01115 [Candidatus Yanofskybacteria bacterium RIFOXYA2_FULL_45_28]OGN38006.1 MAG: hypothetical protein A2405_00745 [Candidatus Yanofskybacteria bacterium RIFOXYC1_FULL_44_16]HAU07880.1 hypothetical protein [Candidatus Yanofskybacteria bacterium]HBT80902.1 hypothetical protein [Candidatus Yanofskybacteria bacterium]